MSDIWRSLIALMFILPSIVIVIYMLKRLTIMPIKQKKRLRITSQLPVNSKHQIAVIEIEDIQLILGLSPGQMTVLHKSEVKPDTPD